MKKFLLATAAVLASTSAYAADYAVVHPFHTPAQGKFVSTTAFDFEHSLTKNKAFDWKSIDSEKILSEKIEYGITDDIQVGFTISKSWGKVKGKDSIGAFSEVDRGYTNAWELEVGYNIINDGKAFLNTKLGYKQEFFKARPEFDFGENTHERAIVLSVFGGYNFAEVTAFGGITYDRQMYDSVNNIDKSRVYTVEAGAFKEFNDQISAHTTLSAEFDETKNNEERTYWWNIGADYSVSKKMAVGVKASYMLGNNRNFYVFGQKAVDTHSAYKLGVDFTVEF